VVVSPLDLDDFNAMLYLEDFRRVEGPNHTPYPPAEAIAQTLRLLQLPAVSSTSPSPALPAESVADLLTRGKALSAQGRTEEALPLFARASELAPESDEVWLNYMEALSSLGREEEARGAFERWLTTEPSIAETCVLRGELLWSDQQYEEALDQFDQALFLEPTNGGALLEKLATLLALGWQEEAERFLSDLGPEARATIQRLTHHPEELAAVGVPADMREMLQRPTGQAVLQTVLGGELWES
jgi:tetratricopeptide (TPR) repeat protein